MAGWIRPLRLFEMPPIVLTIRYETRRHDDACMHVPTRRSTFDTKRTWASPPPPLSVDGKFIRIALRAKVIGTRNKEQNTVVDILLDGSNVCAAAG